MALAFLVVPVLSHDALAQKQIVLKVAHGYPTSHYRHQVAVKLAELTAKYTDNQVKMEIYPAAQLLSEKEMIDGMLMGSVDICLSPNGNVGRYDSAFRVYDIPGLFPTLEDIIRFEKHPQGGLKINDEIEKRKGIKVLLVMNHGPALLYSNRPVSKIDDWKGLKVRVPIGLTYSKAVRALGASPIQMGAAELTSSLQQGIVDASYSSNETSLGTKWHQIPSIKYGTLFPYQWNSFVLMNAKKWRTLPANLQSIMEKKVFPETEKFGHDLSIQLTDKALQQYKKDSGFTIYDMTKGKDAQEFTKRMQPLYKESGKEIGKGYLDLALKLKK